MYKWPVSFRRTLALPAAAAVAALALAGGAEAAIVPSESIAGIHLNMTRHEVRVRSGAPREVIHGTNDFGAYTVFRYRRLRVAFQGNAGATAVRTSRTSQMTARGVGPGSSKADLRDAYPGARCRNEGNGFRHCWLGRFRAGERVTDFRIRDHHVSSVTVAFVID